MRALLFVLMLLPAFSAARAEDDEAEEAPAIQRYLEHIQLGDSISQVKRVYPPATDWPGTDQVNSGVTRYKLERGTTKVFPARVETLYLGFKRDRLVEIEIVYDEKRSRAQTVEKLAGEYALVYGEARRSDERFWWSDGRTVLRVFPAEIPIKKDGAHAVEWRTAVQVFERGLSSRSDN
jgi:hypothetical protein